jgi:hypothetical protein
MMLSYQKSRMKSSLQSFNERSLSAGYSNIREEEMYAAIVYCNADLSDVAG